MMTQQEIADELNIAGSAVNTAISMLIPMDERKRLVQKRRKAARIRELLRVCPHCGKPLD
ncbi:PfWMP4_27 [Phormidium phage Pf-WMP4]|uniref:PfWMP4_27 n=1 Tax=Phormidium phage Pf-WMP4 TaxID=2913979 RepID=Q0GBT9_9CAUD|nr:PfWMP4_27 [Phormidium phage Pf-WMP4]ABI33171.1 PfWMP4_27 [Phormidium phage Pf-WMP4]